MLKVGAPGELINVEIGEDITIWEFALAMAKINSYKGKNSFETSKPGNTPRKLLEVSRFNPLDLRIKIKL